MAGKKEFKCSYSLEYNVNDSYNASHVNKEEDNPHGEYGLDIRGRAEQDSNEREPGDALHDKQDDSGGGDEYFGKSHHSSLHGVIKDSPKADGKWWFI